MGKENSTNKKGFMGKPKIEETPERFRVFLYNTLEWIETTYKKENATTAELEAVAAVAIKLIDAFICQTIF